MNKILSVREARILNRIRKARFPKLESQLCYDQADRNALRRLLDAGVVKMTPHKTTKQPSGDPADAFVESLE